jgi:hypothetical protein
VKTSNIIHAKNCLHRGVCVLKQLGSRGQCVVKLAIPTANSCPPRKSSPYVLPGSTTPPVTKAMLSEGGSNRFHVAWIPWLVVMSEPGPSSHQVFIAGMHLKQRPQPLISDVYKTARTIRGGILAWFLGDGSDSQIVNFARVQ